MKVVKFAFSLFGINSYIVIDEPTRKCAIIDPGMINADEEQALASFVERNQLSVTHVINTHLHIDHAIGDKYASGLFNAPILAHREDDFLGARMKQQAGEFGIAERVDNVSVTSYLHDGEEIHIGDGRLIVLHVPGHSPGSVALYDPEGGYVLSGDALFAGSIGRTDLPGGNYMQLLGSIRNKLFSLPPETVVYPGHGPATTVGREAASNPFFA